MKDGSALILFKDDKKEEVFLVFRSDYPIWGITGGGMEKGENPKVAAIREAEEETGFKVKVARKVATYQAKDHSSYLYEGRILSGTYKPEYPGCIGKWFKVKYLPISMTNRAKEKILECLKPHKKEIIKGTDSLTIMGNLHLFLLHPVSFIRFVVKYRGK
jgi:ADP-ribose pyrophosphatase YjhB (NUDIX family)